MAFLCSILLLALSRAELIARFKAPVVTQANGLVRVYADCAEDLRREYQTPIGRFAADTVATLYRGTRREPVRFQSPGIVIHVGDVRTNDASVVSRVVTNDMRVMTRLYVRSPGYADLDRLRLEIVKGFFRSVEGREVADGEALAVFRASDPAFRVADQRAAVERFWQTGEGDFEEGLRLIRKVIEPGHASQRDVLTFASRLYLYPAQYDYRFAGRFDCLSFREAIRLAKADPFVRLAAALKAGEPLVFGGGRGELLAEAATRYDIFLRALALGEREPEELERLLDEADVKLDIAYEEARKYDREMQR